MVDWTAARAFTEGAVADVFDVTDCRIVPRKTGATVNHADQDDVDRVAFDFKGTIDLEPPADRIIRHAPADPAVRSGVVAYDACLTANVSTWPYMPRRGDIVEVAGDRWKIEAKEADGSSRPAFYLSRAK